MMFGKTTSSLCVHKQKNKAASRKAAWILNRNRQKKGLDRKQPQNGLQIDQKQTENGLKG